jgi:hypothetical protein
MRNRGDHFDIWLVAHADLYKTARMQAFIEVVAHEFEQAP